MVYAAVFMPETLDRTKIPEGGRRGPAFLAALKGPLAFLMVLAFTVSFANANLETTFAYFSKDSFGFGPPQMGLAFTIMGITSVILQGFLIGRIVSRLGEQKVIVYGLGMTAVSFVLITMAKGMLSLTIYLSLSSLAMSLARPGITSLISKKAIAGQGETMGTMSSFDSMGRIIGPVFGGQVYLYHHTYPYWIGAIFLAVMMFITIVRFKHGAGERTEQG